VADVLIPHRPDWVIRTAIKQSDRLIEKTQSNRYPDAARWLERAKKGISGKRAGGCLASIYQPFAHNLCAPSSIAESDRRVVD
jgi:uncharacterized Zn finger protein